MSENKLNKRPAATPSVPKGNLAWKPFVLSDSKGRYIKQECLDFYQISWRAVSGAKTEYFLKWINDNIDALIAVHGKVHFFIWTGTCDFTVKIGKFICLDRDVDSAVEKYKNCVNQIYHTIDHRQNARVTFLKIPYFSILTWNTDKRHSNADIYKDQDLSLKEIITSTNDFLQELNEQHGTYTPNLNADLQRGRKSKGKKTRCSLKISLLSDGIHPGKTLAKAWAINIKKSILNQCQEDDV